MDEGLRRGTSWSSPRWLTRRGGAIVLGVLWVLDGLLQAEPAKLARDWPTKELAQSVMGEPAWLRHSIYAGIAPFEAHWPLWDLAAALLEVAIGLGIAGALGSRAKKPAIVVSLAWSAVVWWIGEGLGLVPTGFGWMLAGAPGAVVVYGMLGLLCWPSGERDVSRAGLRWCWALLWLVAAAAEAPFVYPPGQVLRADLVEGAIGQPGFLVAMAHAVGSALGSHGVAVATGLGVAEAVIGLAGALGSDRWRWPLAAGIALSLVFWVVGQDLGGILTQGGTDPNLGPLVVVLALVAWPRRGRATDPPRSQGSSTLSVRLPIGRHAPVAGDRTRDTLVGRGRYDVHVRHGSARSPSGAGPRRTGGAAGPDRRPGSMDPLAGAA